MTKIKERARVNKTLLFIYIVLVLVIPVIALFASFGVSDNLKVYDTFLGTASRVLYVFVSLPVYAVYANIVIKELFPVSGRKVFYLFIPIIATWLIQIFDKGFTEFWDFLILNSLPLYLGLNLVFVIGLFILIVINAKDESFGAIIGRVIASIIIIILIFAPPVYFFLLGIEMHSVDLVGYEKVRAVAMFIFTILLMAFFHYKIVIELYERGKL